LLRFVAGQIVADVWEDRRAGSNSSDCWNLMMTSLRYIRTAFVIIIIIIIIYLTANGLSPGDSGYYARI